MSDHEQRDNSGVLFKNDDKKSEDANQNWPDYKGWGMVSGVEVWVSAWIKKSKKGTTYMSLSIKPKDAATTAKPRKPEPAEPEFVDDEIPF